MPIISTIKSNAAPKVKEFPKLMIEPSIGRIVLFTEPTNGTVVAQGTGLAKIGHFGTNWIFNLYKDYYGKVTLSNE